MWIYTQFVRSNHHNLPGSKRNLQSLVELRAQWKCCTWKVLSALPSACSLCILAFIDAIIVCAQPYKMWTTYNSLTHTRSKKKRNNPTILNHVHVWLKGILCVMFDAHRIHTHTQTHTWTQVQLYYTLCPPLSVCNCKNVRYTFCGTHTHSLTHS